MQVRTCHTPGASDDPDDLPRLDDVADGNKDLRLVPDSAVHAPAVIDDLLGALSRPLTSPDPEVLAGAEAGPTVAALSNGGEAAWDADASAADQADPTVAEPSAGGEAANPLSERV